MVIITAIVCLAPVVERWKKPLRDAVCDATLAERREERWDGAFGQFGNKNTLQINL